MVRFPDVTVLLADPTLPDASKPGGRFHAEDLDCVTRLRDALDSLDGYRFTFRDRHGGLLQALIGDPPAFALNFCDTGWRNRADRELHVPALLELVDVPYGGRPRPRSHSRGTRPWCAPWPRPWASPSRAVRESLPGHDVLLQEFLPGAEYTVGLIGNPGRDLRALPVLEPDFSDLDAGLPRILGYESKTLPDSPYWTKIRYAEARLDEATRERLVAWSALLFERFGLRDYGRVDFRTDAAGSVKLLEVNENPAWAYDGKLALMAALAGMTYADLLRAILETAQSRAAP